MEPEPAEEEQQQQVEEDGVDANAAEAKEEVLSVPEGMSKSGAKRARKHERLKEIWAAKKKAKKEAQKARKQQQQGKPSAEDEMWKRRREQQDAEDPEAAQKRREERHAKKEEARQDFLRRCQQGARIVIDCGFDEQMQEKEIKSLGQQLMYVYASNKRAASPCTVYITE